MKKNFIAIVVACAFFTTDLFAGPLKIVDVNPSIVCLFSTNCIINVDDSPGPILFNDATGTGELQTRIYVAQTNSPLAGRYGYVYRIDLTRVTSPSTNDYIDSLNINFGPIVPFTYDRAPSNQVWVVTSGGLGTVAPSSALQLGNNIIFRFNPPIHTHSGPFPGQTTYFFGLVSSYPPTNFTAHITGSQSGPIPLNPDVLIRRPNY